MSEEKPGLNYSLNEESENKLAGSLGKKGAPDSILFNMKDFWTQAYDPNEANRRTEIIEAALRKSPVKAR
ncbi:hypothetical protein KKG52_01490 [Patescibacteria group bacterium]|nr:hypothetical protein [Patescibacteria group bacterium]